MKAVYLFFIRIFSVIVVIAFGIFSLLLSAFVISIIKFLATVFNLHVEVDSKEGQNLV